MNPNLNFLRYQYKVTSQIIVYVIVNSDKLTLNQESYRVILL